MIETESAGTGVQPQGDGVSSRWSAPVPVCGSTNMAEGSTDLSEPRKGLFLVRVKRFYEQPLVLPHSRQR